MNLYPHRNFSMKKLVTSGAFSDLYNFVRFLLEARHCGGCGVWPPSSIPRSTIVVANNGMLSDV